jgi:hypothetical protein
LLVTGAARHGPDRDNGLLLDSRLAGGGGFDLMQGIGGMLRFPAMGDESKLSE